MEFYEYDTRVAAYAVIVEDDRMLLSWWNGEGRGGQAWSLPGGGVDLEETVEQGAIREVREETGFDVELTGLLCIDSYVRPPAERLIQTDRWVRHLRIIHTARIVGGTLGTIEVGGSTDYAAWHRITDVPDLEHTGIVDVALAAWRVGWSVADRATGAAAQRADVVRRRVG